jgi:hypothetical protein
MKVCEAVDFARHVLDPDMSKEARHYTNTAFFEALHDVKEDGEALGIGPIKVEFSPEAQNIKDALLKMTAKSTKSASARVETPISSLIRVMKRKMRG